MKKNKLLIAFIILIGLTGIFLVGIRKLKIFPSDAFSSDENLKFSSAAGDLHRLEDYVSSTKSGYDQKLSEIAELMSWSLRQFISDDKYTGPEIFEDGVVIRIEEGKVIYPEEFPGSFADLQSKEDLLKITSPMEDTLTGSDGDPDSRKEVVVTAAQIADDLFYINYSPLDQYETEAEQADFVHDAIATLEKSFDGSLLILSDEDLSVVYCSDGFDEAETVEDLGLSKDLIKSQPAELTIKDRTYNARYENLDLGHHPVQAIILLPPAASAPYNTTGIVIAVIFILLIVSEMILWIYWINDYVKSHELTEREKQKYHPAYVRKIALAGALNGAVLLFITLYSYQILGNLSRSSSTNSEMIKIMETRMESGTNRINSYQEKESKWLIYFAERAAGLFAKYPELQTKEFLAKAAELTGAEYIMVFDSRGREIRSSNLYSDFTLGKEIPSTEAFRFLLQGVDKLILDPEDDPFTGKTHRMAGVRMGLGNEGKNGALILSLNPQNTWESAARQTITDLLKMLTPKNSLAMIADNEAGTVLYSNDPDLPGKQYSEIGIESSGLVRASLETFDISGVKYYGGYDDKELYDYYYMTEARSILGSNVRFAAYGSLSFLVICMTVTIFMTGLPRRKDLNEDAARFREVLQQHSKPGNHKNIQLIDEFMTDELPKDRPLTEWWKDLRPEQKFSRSLELLLTIVMTFGILELINSNGFGSQSVLSFVLKGTWKRGVNELSILAIWFVVMALIYFTLLKDFFLRLTDSILDAKGRTIAGLFSSLSQYAAVIAAVYFSLTYLGFDTGVLVTSAGFLTLAVSLGSKDLVADILSGIILIFEGTFHVGDRVEINGYSGRIIDIGVHSTKLKTVSNDIVVINNQSVKSYMKKADDAAIIINLTVAGTQPLEEIEEMLSRELPKIGEMLPELILGPVYAGVTKIDYRRVTISIVAKCLQKDSYNVTNRLTRELKRVFDKNGLQI